MTRLQRFKRAARSLADGKAAICHWNGIGRWDPEREIYTTPNHFWSWSLGLSYRGIVYELYDDWVWNTHPDPSEHHHINLSVRPEKGSLANLRSLLTQIFDLADTAEITVSASAGDWMHRFVDSRKGLQFGGSWDRNHQMEVLPVTYTEKQLVVLLKELGLHPYCGSREVKGGAYVKDETRINGGTITYRPHSQHTNDTFTGSEDSLFAPGWEAA